MSHQEYTVKVLSDRTKYWYQNGQLHRLDGPAIEWANGYKWWYLNGKHLSESDWKDAVAKLNAPPSCDGKIVDIDGIKYRLTSV